MSSIRNISASNNMPVDLAKKLGKNGITELLSVMWLSYDDLYQDGIVSPDMGENEITQEWFIRISARWYRENRASRVSLNLAPITQYEDETLAKPKGQSPTIDFCFRAWEKSDGYFGAECKNLYHNDSKHIKRYVTTGVENYTSGRYGSKSSVSSMVGYVLSGSIPDLVDALRKEIAKTKPHMNLTQATGTQDAQYKSTHRRSLDDQEITLHHLFFNFVA